MPIGHAWNNYAYWSLHDNDGQGAAPGEQVYNGNSTVFFDGHVEYAMYSPYNWNTDGYLSGNP